MASEAILGSKTSLLTFALVLAGNRILIHFTSGHMEISVHQRFQAPREQRERATHASRLEFFSLIIFQAMPIKNVLPPR